MEADGEHESTPAPMSVLSTDAEMSQEEPGSLASLQLPGGICLPFYLAFQLLL